MVTHLSIILGFDCLTSVIAIHFLLPPLLGKLAKFYCSVELSGKKTKLSPTDTACGSFNSFGITIS